MPGASSSKQKPLPPKGVRGESGYVMIDVNGNKGGDGVGLDDLKAIMLPRLPVSAGDRGMGECAKPWCHLVTPKGEAMSGGGSVLLHPGAPGASLRLTTWTRGGRIMSFLTVLLCSNHLVASHDPLACNQECACPLFQVLALPRVLGIQRYTLWFFHSRCYVQRPAHNM